MKKWLRKLEVMAMAVAFAEAGEWAYAEKIMEREQKKPSVKPKLNKKPDNRQRMRV